MHCEYLEMISDDYGMYTYYCDLLHQVIDINECMNCDSEVSDDGVQTPI